MAIAIEVPRGIFASKAGERYCDFGAPENELVVKICKAKEGLNILYFVGFWPIEDTVPTHSIRQSRVTGPEVETKSHGGHGSQRGLTNNEK
jgi:hypothetical protein